MKENNPVVSIVIPVYNAENYLIKCLDSIANQTHTNFECIMVVDGATDKSYEIAETYCSKDTRFKVFYQDNAGSGPARNNGITHSTGEFICFIDPDDWVEADYISSLVEEQQKGDYDLVISQTIDRRINAKDELVGTTENHKPIINFLTQEDCRKQFPHIMFDLHYLDGPICKLFKTSLIRENGIQFPPYRRSQDMVFNFRYFNHINSISTISNNTYNIRYEYPPRPGRGRVFTNYYEIVAKIYFELSEQLRTWGIISKCDVSFHTWSYWYLYASITRNIMSGLPYSYVTEEPYKTIVHRARPTLLLQKVVRVLLDLKLFKLSELFIKATQKLK